MGAGREDSGMKGKNGAKTKARGYFLYRLLFLEIERLFFI